MLDPTDPPAPPDPAHKRRVSHARRAEELGLPPHRTLEDPKALRALAHPTRMALIELLGLRGPMTATQAAEVVNVSPTNCAFHLRTLAKYGFVAEAEGGRGRERPWELALSGMSWSRDSADAAAYAAGKATLSMMLERWFDRVRRYTANDSAYPREIRNASMQSQTLWWATPEEIEAIKVDLDEVMTRHAERFDPERRPAGAIPFEGLFFVHPFDDPETLATRESSATAKSHHDDRHDDETER
jgi:predicted transcriptional regulator